MASPVSRRSLTDRVADALVDLIRERGLKDGDPIPATADLSESFDVSRTVVREAMAELAGRGLLLRQQGRESVVASPGSRHLEQLLRYRIENARISDDDVQQYRESVEVAAARLAARNATVDDIELLEERLEALRNVGSTGAALHDADAAFHKAVAQAGGNELLILTLDALTPLLKQLRIHAWRGWVAAGGGAASIIEAHAEILDRIRARDEQGAGAAMEAHLKQARRGLETSARPRRGS